MTFALFLLAAAGLSSIIVQGKIFDEHHIPLRRWLNGTPKREATSTAPARPREYGLLGAYGDIVECHECTGFWCGLLAGLVLISWNPFVILMCGFAGAFVSMWSKNLADFFESNTSYVVDDGEQQ